MPSKRNLIGDDPGNRRHALNIRWSRILAFCGGIVALVSILFLHSLAGSQHPPVWTNTGLLIVSVGLFWYSLARWRWQTVFKTTAGIAAGSLFAVYIT